MKRVTVPLIVLMSIIVPAAAARGETPRAPTPDEAAAIYRDAEVEPGCGAIRIISDPRTPGASYARVDITNPPPDDCPDTAEGFVALSNAAYVAGHWGKFIRASDAKPSCSERKLPDSVGRDLGICFPAVPRAKTTMTCWGKTTELGGGVFRTARRVRSRPASCFTGGPYESNAGSVLMRSTRWSSWGSSAARGRGFSQALHGSYVNGKIRFERYRAIFSAYGLREVKGRRFYTRLRVTTKFGTGSVKLSAPDAEQYVYPPED